MTPDLSGAALLSQLRRGRVRVPRPLDTADWLELRRPYWNASLAAVLTGQHPYVRSIAAVIRDKQHPATGRGVENSAMRRGQFLEPAVGAWWAADHNVDIYEPDVVYTAWPFMATLDRRIVGDDQAAVEIKTTRHTITEPARHWELQCQVQMRCAHLNRVHLVVLDSTLRLQTFLVERDDELIDQLTDRAAPIMDCYPFDRWPAGIPGRTIGLPRRR